MSSFEIEGSEIIKWLKLVEPDFANNILIGCGIDDGVSEELLCILDIEHIPNYFVCDAGEQTKRIPFAAVRSSSVVDERPGTPLKSAIEQYKTPVEKSLDTAKQQLKSLGVSTVRISNREDVFILLETMNDHESEVLPIRFDRDVRYDVLKRTDMFRLGAEICDRWRKLTLDNRGPVLVDVFIKLAFFLRHSGQLKKALRATQLIELRSPVVKLSMGEKSVLATIRSSILLDLFETNRDLEDLKQARSYAGLAWANGQSDETNMVYQRLKKYENLVKDEQAIIERENSMRRLTNPEDDDAFKPYLEADKEKNENMSEEKSEHPSSDETNN